jgi:Flp pilus assembly secretin CpaC
MRNEDASPKLPVHLTQDVPVHLTQDVPHVREKSVGRVGIRCCIFTSVTSSHHRIQLELKTGVSKLHSTGCLKSKGLSYKTPPLSNIHFRSSV